MVDSRAAKKVLIVENKHLNPENEMKRIFGSRVVASEANQRQKKGRGGRGHQVLVSHWLILITLISDWSILITLISDWLILITRFTTAPPSWSLPSPSGPVEREQV